MVKELEGGEAELQDLGRRRQVQQACAGRGRLFDEKRVSVIHTATGPSPSIVLD